MPKEAVNFQIRKQTNNHPVPLTELHPKQINNHLSQQETDKTEGGTRPIIAESR